MTVTPWKDRTHPEPPPDPLEGATGRTFKISGNDITLYSISDLAFALNRQPVTVRRWEAEAIIPKATYVLPGKDRKHGRRRFYSREQIEGMVKIAAEEGILDNPHAVIKRTQFRAKALELFKELAKK